MQTYPIDKNLTIYRNVFDYIDSNMYVIIENNQALIIDPHRSQEVYDLLIENNIKDITIFLTHEHTDHISGIRWFKENFNTKIVSSEYCSDYMSNSRLNRPILASFILEEKDKNEGTHLLEKFNSEYEPYLCSADITFNDDFEYMFNSHKFKFKRLLGHSKGSCCIIMDEKYIFTGDTLLKDYPVITRFPGGSKKEYINSTIPFFENLDKNLIVFPGHGNNFKLKEIMKGSKLNVEFR